MATFQTTFVTAYIYLPSTYTNGGNENNPLHWRITHFEDIASTGIPICLYSCQVTRPILEEVAAKYTNVRLMDYDYTLSNTYKVMMRHDLARPRYRNVLKDTLEYMVLMNCKIDFMNHAVQENPWNTDSFAWIDFGIGYILKDRENTLKQLQSIGRKRCISDTIAIAGINDPPPTIDYILDAVYWRFCGGFFIGNKTTIKDFYLKCKIYYLVFIAKYKYIVWEVNIWAWLENIGAWRPLWYLANHDDTIFNVPESILVE